MNRPNYHIGEIARISGVSIRMLRHYDQLGLLVPSNRTSAGYRLYNNADLLRLQQIMIGRTLGLALEDIRRQLDDTDVDHRDLLIQQRKVLCERAQATEEMIHSIDTAISLLDKSEGDTIMNLKNIFDGFDSGQFEGEVQARWGTTDAYQESIRRSRNYTKETYELIKSESASILSAIAVQLNAGAKPDDEAVIALAEQHRLSIDRWFYPCSVVMHCALADMYETDERFAKNIDKFGEGLTPFLSAAIRANADNKIV